MMNRISIAACFFVFGLALVGGTWAPAEPLVAPTGQIAQDYEAALRWHRVDMDLVYLDPSQPIPSLADLVEEPSNAGRDEAAGTLPVGIVRIALLAALALLLFFLWRASQGQFVRFADTIEPQRRPRGEGSASGFPGSPAKTSSIEEIRANPDLRAATIALLHLALPHAVERNGLHLHPSWTARDVLARVPDRWPSRGDLATLVRAAEEAHFGNYPVSELGFAASLGAAERILRPEGRV